MTSAEKEYWQRIAIGGSGIQNGDKYVHLGRDKYMHRPTLEIVFRRGGEYKSFSDIDWGVLK